MEEGNESSVGRRKTLMQSCCLRSDRPVHIQPAAPHSNRLIAQTLAVAVVHWSGAFPSKRERGREEGEEGKQKLRSSQKTLSSSMWGTPTTARATPSLLNVKCQQRERERHVRISNNHRFTELRQPTSRHILVDRKLEGNFFLGNGRLVNRSVHCAILFASRLPPPLK